MRWSSIPAPVPSAMRSLQSIAQNSSLYLKQSLGPSYSSTCGESFALTSAADLLRRNEDKLPSWDVFQFFRPHIFSSLYEDQTNGVYLQEHFPWSCIFFELNLQIWRDFPTVFAWSARIYRCMKDQQWQPAFVYSFLISKKPKGINELDKSTLKSYIGKAQAERLDNINKMEKEFKRGVNSSIATPNTNY